jgi:hypothetical protein
MEIEEAPEKHESYQTTFRTIYEKSANYVDKLQKQAEVAEVARVEAEMDLNTKFAALSDYFRRDSGYRTAFEEFESQVFAKHGSAAVPYIDLIHKTACPNEERGVHDAGYMMFEPCKEAQLFDSLMKLATQMLETEKLASEASENLQYEQAYLKEAHKLLGKQAEEDSEVDHLPTTSVKKECDPVLVRAKKKAADSSYSVTEKCAEDPVHEEYLEKEAFFGPFSTLMSLTRAGAALSGDKHENPLIASVTEAFTKEHQKPIKPNLTLDNMERTLLLQELMLTDPILSKLPPAKVARAFEQLLRLSPEISKEKEVVRAQLRAMVSSQALSVFDADLMTKLDTGMLKRRIATQQFNLGRTEHFKI